MRARHQPARGEYVDGEEGPEGAECELGEDAAGEAGGEQRFDVADVARAAGVLCPHVEVPDVGDGEG